MTRRAKQVLIGASLLAAASLLVTYSLRIWPFVVDDDDRPPIIVNNGSLILTAAPHKDGPGTWTREGKRRYRHEHPHGAPKTFRVTPSNYQSCQNLPASGDARRIEVVELEFVGAAGVQGAVTLDIVSRGAGNFLTVFVTGVNASVNSTSTQLTIDVERLTAATLYDRNDRKDPIECTFTADKNQKLQIEQKR